MTRIRNLQSVRQAKTVQQVKQIYQAFREFIHLETSGGIVLMAAAVIALLWANSPWSSQYFALWESELSFGFGGRIITHDLHWWINDALMAVFFLVVGLEIKREVLVGELNSIRQAALPLSAAIGGMVAPALIYAAFNLGTPGIAGWGVPMATDIAFALGVMALAGSRVPFALKVFLTALAIVDDIGAVLVIALFYTSSVSWIFLAAAFGIFVLLIGANILGVRNIIVYSLLGIALWVMILYSGVHATLAGVILAMTIPASRKIKRDEFKRKAHSYLHDFDHAGEVHHRLLSVEQQQALLSLETVVEDVQAPLQKMEHGLHPWVIFGIIPLFALANAGINIGGNLSTMLLDRVSLGIIAGLVLGKQIGITLGAWLAVKLRFAQLPAGVTWRQIYAVGWLAGIGFTMSLYISELAFGAASQLDAAKVGILAASLLAGLVGFFLLRQVVLKPSEAEIEHETPVA